MTHSWKVPKHAMTRAKKILVVDDSAMIRRLIREELESAGYSVFEAANGFEALVRATEPPAPDLITLDIDMPGLGGFETFRKLNENHYRKFFTHVEGSRIPIVFVTANDTISVRQKGFSLGAADFIVKPFAKGTIQAAVDAVFQPDSSMAGMGALVVDDNATARSIVADHLSREGIQVLEAENGVEACHLLDEKEEEIHIVVTDLVMPKMDGIALCKEIRSRKSTSDIPVIFLTALADQQELLKVFAAGATDYLVKPFFKEELLARINVHLDRSRLTRKLRRIITELKISDEKTEGGKPCACSAISDLDRSLREISGYAKKIEDATDAGDASCLHAKKIIDIISRLEMGDKKATDTKKPL